MGPTTTRRRSSSSRPRSAGSSTPMRSSRRFSPPAQREIFQMINYVIRNARVHGRGETPADIGFEKGRIASIETSIVCDALSSDAEGFLGCGGLIETHIHLDKSRIIDRCAPEKGRDHHA